MTRCHITRVFHDQANNVLQQWTDAFAERQLHRFNWPRITREQCNIETRCLPKLDVESLGSTHFVFSTASNTRKDYHTLNARSMTDEQNIVLLSVFTANTVTRMLLKAYQTLFWPRMCIVLRYRPSTRTATVTGTIKQLQSVDDNDPLGGLTALSRLISIIFNKYSAVRSRPCFHPRHPVKADNSTIGWHRTWPILYHLCIHCVPTWFEMLVCSLSKFISTDGSSMYYVGCIIHKGGR